MIEAALVKEQGVTFAVVPVKNHVVASSATSRFVAAGFAGCWPGAEIILVAQDARGVPTYVGRRDIVRFLANTPMEDLPWGAGRSRRLSLG